MNEILVYNRSVVLPAEPPAAVQLSPYGEFDGYTTDGQKVVQRLDRAAAAELARAFNAAQRDALVDFEHWSSRPDGDTGAAAWITRLESRDDGLYGLVDWSTRGASAVRNREYRYLSPVWDLVADGEKNGFPVGVPVWFKGAGLTNKPQIKAIKPIANRENAGMFPENPNGGENMKEVAKLLNLDENADEAAIVDAVKSVQNKAQAAENRAKEVENKALEAEAAQFVADHADAIADPDKVKTQYIENKDATVALFGSLRKPAEKTAPKSVHNREQTRTPDVDALKSAADPSAEQRNAVKKYQIENKCSFEQAWDMVRMEKPELFKTKEIGE
jgi:phage I-like protein